MKCSNTPACLIEIASGYIAKDQKPREGGRVTPLRRWGTGIRYNSELLLCGSLSVCVL